jgi:ABC-type transport system substrate-binding protein
VLRPQVGSASQYFQATWNRYNNVKVDIDPAASATELALVQAGNFTASMYGNPFDDPEPGWTGNFTCAASPSISGWCDPTFDSLVQKNRETLVPSERITAIKDAQKILYAAVPSLWFERRATWIAGDPAVQNVQWVDDGLPMFDRMWIKSH